MQSLRVARLLEGLPSWLPHAAAAAGLIVYLAFSIYHAHTQASVLDEGMYLYKGWLFASGRYMPYQDFGPWTNHMPLSYLLPGWVEEVFGPGLRTGRWMAVITGSLSVAGLWVMARRFGGSWLGAAAVWVVAFNPALTKIFSLQASQGLAACLLLWSLVFTLGDGRRSWEIAAGGLLAGALALTRINLSPVLPLLILYASAQHGRKAGAIFSGAGLGIFGFGHAVYWPEILRLWAPWVPDSLSPFLDPFRRPPDAAGYWSPEIDIRGRIASFMQGLRFQFIPIWSAAASTVFWPSRSESWTRGKRRTAFTMLTLFGVLLALHAWAALGKSYCVFCFPVYLSFFSLPALAVLSLTLPHWTARRSGSWTAVAILVTGAALGASAAEVVGPRLLGQQAVVRLLRFEVPRTSGVGTIPLWGLIENFFGMDYETAVRTALVLGRILLSGGIGLAAALGSIFLARAAVFIGRPFAQRAVITVLIVGWILSPTAFLAGGYRTFDCSGNVIDAYETAGSQLSEIIPPGAKIYWAVGGSPAPLLYLPDARIFPAQLNGVYSYKIGGEPQALARFGHWNRELAMRWIAEADFVLTGARALPGPDADWLADVLAESEFRTVGETVPLHPCEPGSQILIHSSR